MSSNKDYKYIDSRKIISRVRKKTGLTQKAIAEQVFKISAKNLSNRIFRDGIDLYTLLDWAIHNNVDINWLVTGEGHEPNQGHKLGGPPDNDERAWFRGVIDELRERCRKLEKRLEYYEDPSRKSRIRRDDDPAERDEILKNGPGDFRKF